MTSINRTQAMQAVQTTHFTLVDIGMYLDTHPGCRMGLEFYQQARRSYEAALKFYEDTYGPITMSRVEGDTWTWTRDPWPWELEG